MQKREAKFGIRFRHWIKANPLPYSATFELKDCSHKTSFPFTELKEHQQNWARAIASDRGVLMRQLGGNGEPDYTYHITQPAFIVINFKDGFEVINYATLELHIQKSKRKSLTHAKAKLISTFSV